jgi:probable phosphoglycerate mutase
VTEPGEIWVTFDGASRGNPGHAAIGAVVNDSSGRIAEVSEYIGEATNNVAEYRALIAGLHAALPFQARVLHVRGDSKLVIEQMRGRWKVKHAVLKPLAREAVELLRRYDTVDIEHIPRERNAEADALANAALDAR